ncbi:MAG TPA: acyl--CoA ligase [Candidatus Saccharimonadales bacterium]|jgi:acyl-CoA synthetase (AMP-forming)/AMP-acid ligase II|nr:acyl--CoA ligase [Candidatus Saccharimonadales bacterium]
MEVCTLAELLNGAPAQSRAVILPESGISITYESLRRQVMDMAQGLAGAGIRPGDRVAIVLPNGLATIVSFLAAAIAGTAAPLNQAYKYEEFCFYLEDTNARLLLAPAEGADDARRAAKERGIPVFAVVMDVQGNVHMAGAPPGGMVRDPAPDDIALVLHTSGSTGRPKRVPLKHRNLAISTGNVVATYKLTADDVSLCVMPLFHVHGLVASTLSTFRSGGTVIVPEKFNPMSFWRTVRDHKATWYSCVPTIHQLAVARLHEKPEGIESLRFVRSCSSALSPALMEKIEGLVGVPVLEAYGMTEASHQMCSNPLPPGQHKGGSVGPGTGVKVSIMDEAGRHVPKGQLGEVVIQGPNVIEGYENNPEANAKSFTNGWFRTGDQGHIDSDGYLHLTARLKELINRGGEKIAPLEIDEVMLTHPAVAEAVAFGMPHPTWGEEVAIAVVLKEPHPEASLIEHCKLHLADFKVPKKVMIVDKIPRTATGKIQRRAVADALSPKPS